MFTYMWVGVYAMCDFRFQGMDYAEAHAKCAYFLTQHLFGQVVLSIGWPLLCFAGDFEAS